MSLTSLEGSIKLETNQGFDSEAESAADKESPFQSKCSALQGLPIPTRVAELLPIYMLSLSDVPQRSATPTIDISGRGFGVTHEVDAAASAESFATDLRVFSQCTANVWSKAQLTENIHRRGHLRGLAASTAVAKLTVAPRVVNTHARMYPIVLFVPEGLPV